MNKPTLQNFLTDAKSMFELNKYYLVLASVRPGLEYAVKSLCKTSHLDYDSIDTNLESMINSLKDAGIISKDLAALMHKTRRCSNIGVHVKLKDDNIEEVNKDQAVEAFENFRQLCGLLTETDYSSIAVSVQDVNNVPMKYPDYYDTKRRYSGMWADCISRESLMIKPEYVELYTKAMEEEDIEAMLNIAVGFLSKKTIWENDLVKFKEKDRRHTYTIINYRYYYWVVRAAYYAAKHFTEGKYIPKKYIATAIWDAYRYLLETAPKEIYGYYSCSLNQRNTTIYGYGEIKPEDINKLYLEINMDAKELFGPDKFDLLWLYQHLPEFTKELEPFLETLFTGEPIIVPVHPDANTDTLDKFRGFNKYFQEELSMESAKAIAEKAHLKQRKAREEDERKRREWDERAAAENAERERKQAEREAKKEKCYELHKRNTELNDEKRRCYNDGLFGAIKHKEKIKKIEAEIARNDNERAKINIELDSW